MEKNDTIIIIGAGIFGLSTAHQLASEGYQNITILDRHMPPVPDGSSSDISRVIRFDYADEDYFKLAREAYLKWAELPRYKGIFYPSSYILTGSKFDDGSWIDHTTSVLTKYNMPWSRLEEATDAKKRFPILKGKLASPFSGYCHLQAGWVDANKAVVQLRDHCLELGVSFICGPAGTVTELQKDPLDSSKIGSVRTMSGVSITGDHFVLAAGAWAPSLVPMYNSMLATAQVIAYTALTDFEMEKYKDLPIYCNFSTGWFNLPPHQGARTLKMAVHGWGYTRTDKSTISSPPLHPPRHRANFCPIDGEERLREGLREILPELADRPFERVAMCWYTDTPTGDFVLDYHPDYTNLFIGGAGSGHAFKFLPILGNYLSLAIKKELPQSLKKKWRFRTEYEHEDVFLGDGSRAGPIRRELNAQEIARLTSENRAKI